MLIITERLSKTNESKAAFVFNFVAHVVESPDSYREATGEVAKLRL
jgi:hypothetical protein